MDERRSIVVWVMVAMVLMLLPGIYMGSYYALLDTCTCYNFVPENDGVTRQVRLGSSPTYPLESEWIDIIFGPAHSLDRHFRPQLWALGEPKPVPLGFDPLEDDLFLLRWDEDGRLITDAAPLTSTSSDPASDNSPLH